MRARISELRPPAGRLAPAVVAVGVANAGAAAALLRTTDLSGSRLLPPCPFHALTGYWCPGCGSTRALHRLLNGDVAGAIGFNPLLVAALPVVAVAVAMWSARRVGLVDEQPVVLHRALPWTVLAVVLSFWILRNIPAGPFPALAP